MADTTPSVRDPILALANKKVLCVPKVKKVLTGVCVDTGNTVLVDVKPAKKQWFSWRSAATPAQPASAAVAEGVAQPAGQAQPAVNVLQEGSSAVVPQLKLVQSWRYSCHKSNGLNVASPGVASPGVASPGVASPGVASPVPHSARKWFFSSCVSSVTVDAPGPVPSPVVASLDVSVASPVVSVPGSSLLRRFCRQKKLPATPLNQTTLAVREPSSVPGEVPDQDPSKPVVVAESQ